MKMAEHTGFEGENDKPGQAPAGTGCTGRATRRVTKDGRSTVKAKKSRGGVRSGMKRSRKGKTGRKAGRNVMNCVTEALRVLKSEGYIAGRVEDRDVPFDILATNGNETIRIRAIRPREEVTNAAGVRQYHSREVLELQPYWESDTDNIQIWISSRVAGLLRYRVFRCGIWNIETMQEGWQEKRKEKADSKSAKGGIAIQKSRTASLPV
jgi:hypothetical protein